MLTKKQRQAKLARGEKLTIEDIRNPARSSGFDHVSSAKGGSKPGNGNDNWSEKWRAALGSRATAKDRAQSWRGPSRKFPETAAQDYCDYVNGLPTSMSLPSYPDVQIDMGNTKRHAPKLEKIEVKRAKYEGPHDVYDVLFLSANGDIICRKAGITARGHARYADVCKTLGMSIKPVTPAKTYPSEAAARVAEAAKVANICKDKKWRRIGKESFAPVV